MQAIDDQQTQQLPSGESQQLRVAASLGYSTWSDFERALGDHRSRVAEVFREYITGSDDKMSTAIWPLHADSEDALSELGFVDASSACRHLERLASAVSKSSVGREAETRLDQLLPKLLEDLSGLSQPDRALERMIPVLSAVLRRSAYLALLAESEGARVRFAKLAHDSKWICDQLALHPILLDTLLEGSPSEPVPQTEELFAELSQRLAAFRHDEEQQAEVLREFKHFHSFRVATGEVTGSLPLMRVSDYLTHVAEAVLQATLDLGWGNVAPDFEPELARHRNKPFIMVGYGKLGGLELGHGSDLDLVFLHDLAADGNRFLHRLVRRLMHLLSTRTHLGPLYEVDMRLRPGGNSMPLTSTLEGFRRYQYQEAWVWEHQALVRSRVVAGDPELADRFQALRREVLCQPRDSDKLRGEVVAMRNRMLTHAGKRPDGGADLKRASGGIVDIEFMVQYLVLAWAHSHPQLSVFTDNTRILEAVAEARLLPADECQQLTDAYHALRSEGHRAALDIPDEARQAEVLAQHRDRVRASWDRVLGENA